jgi:hypothetical protein
MDRFYTIAAIVSLLASFFEAPYFHLHGNPASDHARKHHHGKGLTLHSHISFPQHRAEPLLEIPASAENANNDAIFVVQSSSLTPLFLLPTFLPEDAIRFTDRDPAQNLVLRPAYRSHDPPFIPANSPRPPPA